MAILLEPTGCVRVVATMEQLLCPAFRTVGHTFPQCSVAAAPLADAAKAIGKQLADARFVGALSA